jgi:protein-tyrosine phosphatase
LAMQFYAIELDEQKRLQSVMDWHSNGSGTRAGDQPGQAQGQGMSDWEEQRAKDKHEVERLRAWAGAPQGMGNEDYYPFSITAGVERGTKNRCVSPIPSVDEYSPLRVQVQEHLAVRFFKSSPRVAHGR